MPRNINTHVAAGVAVSVKQIGDALARLDVRRPQLPELYCSVGIYSDGSGFVNDGLDLPLAWFGSENEILAAIDGIPSA